MLVTALMLSVHTDYINVGKRNPNFQYREAQASVAVFILVICFTGKSPKYENFIQQQTYC